VYSTWSLLGYLCEIFFYPFLLLVRLLRKYRKLITSVIVTNLYNRVKLLWIQRSICIRARQARWCSRLTRHSFHCSQRTGLPTSTTDFSDTKMKLELETPKLHLIDGLFVSYQLITRSAVGHGRNLRSNRTPLLDWDSVPHFSVHRRMICRHCCRQRRSAEIKLH